MSTHRVTSIEILPDCPKCKTELQVISKVNRNNKPFWIVRCPSCSFYDEFDTNPIKHKVVIDDDN